MSDRSRTMTVMKTYTITEAVRVSHGDIAY